MPKGTIRRKGIIVKREELSKEELEEVLLYSDWIDSDERKALEACRRNTNR